MSSRYASRASQEAERALREAQSRTEGNQYCADCGATRPEYINLTIGTFICDLCADIHRTSSNRRIKDVYAGDITMEDVRRMDTVGNDVANRKFLATWNPREVPEPDRRDKESLREFLWLKYEGSFKKMPAPTPPPQQLPERDRYNDNRYDDRSRERDAPYRREQQLFRDPPPAQDRSRNYWSTRFSEATRQSQPPPPAPPRHDDYYRRGEAPAQPFPDRYRSTVPSDRFRPPQPAPLAPYDLARSARARYPESYDEYATGRGYDRDRRYAMDLSKYQGPEPGEYSDEELDVDRMPRKKKSSKSKRRSKASSGNQDSDGNYYDDEEDEEMMSERRAKKGQSSKSKKKATKDSRKSVKTKRRTEDEESYETPTSSSESEDEYEQQALEKKKSKRRGKAEKRREREVDSVKSLEDDAVSPNPVAQNMKGEFDLMSDWMGDSKDTEGSQGVPPAVTTGTPGATTGTAAPSAIPAALHQAYQTAQVPMMPMSMYNSVMPMPGGGFMPMMPPGFVPGMPMQGMPGMPTVMPTPMSGLHGAAGVTGTNTSGIPGLINGMSNVTLGQQPAGSGQGATPPPPPPIGVPAGPPPGPPPEPPHE